MTGALTCVPQGFRIDVAMEVANLIVAAYNQYKAPRGVASNWPLSSPYELVAPFAARLRFHDTETFGFVARRTDTGDVFVVFRGTESPEDWLVNVEVRQVPQPQAWGRVEEGFAAVYEQCSSAILDAIRRSTPQSVIVAGHSLGGALATLCATDIRASSGITPVLYTFASPRVGDPVFAGRFNAECPRTWRVVNTEDLITNVPPSTSALDSRHPALLDRALHVLTHVPLISAWVRHRMGWTQLWRSNDVYEHVGTPVDFTKNNGTVLANHEIATYLRAIGAPGVAPPSSDA